jgi:Flp pilus assembly protein TadD
LPLLNKEIDDMNKKRLNIRYDILALLFLVIITGTAYLQVKDHDFVNYDDNEYIAENLHVQAGLTFENVAWAFGTYHVSNWHPLTWISHMLDVQLFGLKPGAHHIINLLFHVANTLLLFLVLHRMTNVLWQCVFVAAVFALHPLHVESVAWASERKDVLSTFFWLLTIGAYVYYVERPGFKRYLLVILCLALGLMSKPMLVTLPFVLLLLDYWPLHRLQSEDQTKTHQKLPEKPAEHRDKKQKPRNNSDKIPSQMDKTVLANSQWSIIRQLVLEKVPLLVLSVSSCIITYIAQQKGGSLRTLEVFPLTTRIANASVSYVGYVWKMIWPDNLAVFYPHPGMLPLWQVLGASLLLIGITLMVICTAKRLPYLAVGWLWYIGTLVPVIGIVQVGLQARADRYTYIPLIGLFIIVAWGIPESLKRWRHRKEALFASAALSLSCLFIVTWTQVGYWQNSITLFDHTLKVTAHNSIAHYNRATAYLELGNYRQAIGDYDRAIEINPKSAEAYYNRGTAYGRLGNDKQAIGDYDRAIEISPRHANAYNNRGIVYGRLGNNRQAIEDYGKAIEINQKNAEAYYNRGIVYARLSNYKQAIGDFDRAIELNPKSAEAHYNRAASYYNLGNQRQAFEDLKTAARYGDEDAKNFLRGQGIDW